MRLLRAALFFSASAAFSACGSVHLHDAQREAAATAAKADYDASKFGDAIKAQSALIASLERREIAAFQRYTHAERDKALLALVQGSELQKRRTHRFFMKAQMLSARNLVLRIRLHVATLDDETLRCNCNLHSHAIPFTCNNQAS